ncbi:MAG: hypothetical protein LBC77_02035 [Spirochaetaceae bacterium]|jgi:hypothetical protein|nr:hypothetical protein [Spirochaetaceae bacterium]
MRKLKVFIAITGALVIAFFAALIAAGNALGVEAAVKITDWLSCALYPVKLTLHNPAGVTITDDNKLIIVDSGRTRVIKASLDGGYDMILNASEDFIDVQDAILTGGKIIIKNIDFGTSKMHVQSESIIARDITSGGYTTIFEQDYRDSGVYKLRPSIFGPYCVQDMVYIIIADLETVTLVNLSRENTPVTRFQFADADLVIASFATDGQTVWFTHKKGVVYKSSGGKPEVVYNGDAERAFLSMPWELTQRDGEPYWSDLGSRSVYKLSAKGGRERVFSPADSGVEPRTFGGYPVYRSPSVNASGFLAVVGGDRVIAKNPEGRIVFSNHSFRLKPAMLLRKFAILIITGAAGILLTAVFCMAAVKLFGMLMRTFSGKLAVSISIMIVVSLFIVLKITGDSSKEINEERIYALLSTLVYTGGKILDSQALVNINRPSDYMNGDYKKLWESVHQMIDYQSEWGQGLYCILYRYENGILYSVLFLDGSVGAYYPYQGANGIDLEAILKRGEMRKGTQEDFVGTWVYVQGPVTMEEEIVGIIEVGLAVGATETLYSNAERFIFLMVLATGIVIQIVVMVIIKLVAKSRLRKCK